MASMQNFEEGEKTPLLQRGERVTGIASLGELGEIASFTPA
jgi:hypothetical protein